MIVLTIKPSLLSPLLLSSTDQQTRNRFHSSYLLVTTPRPQCSSLFPSLAVFAAAATAFTMEVALRINLSTKTLGDLSLNILDLTNTAGSLNVS